MLNDQHRTAREREWTTEGSGYWTTGLFGCLRDKKTCFYTLICPCVVIGENAEIASDGDTGCAAAGCFAYFLHAFTCCSWAYTYRFRHRLRQKFHLPETCALFGVKAPGPVDDCLVHLFCSLCAFCQERRELMNRGWEPSVSYGANVAVFQQKAIMTSPHTVAEMTRRGSERDESGEEVSVMAVLNREDDDH